MTTDALPLLRAILASGDEAERALATDDLERAQSVLLVRAEHLRRLPEAPATGSDATDLLSKLRRQNERLGTAVRAHIARTLDALGTAGRVGAAHGRYGAQAVPPPSRLDTAPRGVAGAY